MPNRIIKESIHESEKVNRMTDFEFRLWVNLITYVDDYGRGDARPAIIKGKCFPLRERLTNADIAAALRSLAGIGCISLYEVDGKSYLCFPRWESHQRVRTKVSKYPAPQEYAPGRDKNQAFDSIPPHFAATRGEMRLESNPNPNPNPNPNVFSARTRAHALEEKCEDDGFDRFWAAYPRQSGDIRRAYTAYRRAIDYGATLDDMLSALEWQKSQPSWLERNGQFIPSAEKWLDNRAWLQERPKSVSTSTTQIFETDTEKLEGMRRMLKKMEGLPNDAKT